MPIKGGKYRTITTSGGETMRLHFTANGKVNEAKNMKTGKTHTPAEFKADKLKSNKLKSKEKYASKSAKMVHEKKETKSKKVSERKMGGKS